MNSDSLPLPDSVDMLQALMREQALEIERLKAQLIKLKRLQFGRSSKLRRRARRPPAPS